MGKTIRKSVNSLISSILSIITIGAYFSASCSKKLERMYGSPDVIYKTVNFYGKVNNRNQDSIVGIKITAVDSSLYEHDTVSGFSNFAGDYLLPKAIAFDAKNIKLTFTDIDGALNGSYQKLDTIIRVDNLNSAKNDPHKYDETDKHVNIVLKEKE